MTCCLQQPGLAEAERLYGYPLVRDYDLGNWGDRDRFWEMWGKRRGEVVLVLQRPDGRLILQTKAFYPPGAFRLPTGSIKDGEHLLAAVRRETMEETGLPARIQRFLGVLCYTFYRRGRRLERASYVFLLEAGQSEIRPQDESEQITAYREVWATDLGAVADSLSALASEWAPWGQFRALVHRFVAEVLAPQHRVRA